MDLTEYCDTLFRSPLVAVQPSERADAETVRRVVRHYAETHGCTPSNTRAAENVALAVPPGLDTMTAIRVGQAHARKLLQKQGPMTPEAA